jgi:hypothetical protein
MKAAGTILALLIVVAVIWFLVKSQLSSRSTGTQPPSETIDVVGVKSDLLTIAQAERMYLAIHGSYATVDQLQQDGSIAFSAANRRGYNYTAELDDGQHFRVTAVPADPAKAGWPTLSMDETMQLAQH